MEQNKEIYSTSISLKKRSELLVSGVSDIISSDESSIYLDTPDGGLIIEGSSLRIISMNVAGGDLTLEGKIDSLAYNEKAQAQKSGFFARMFK
jgi:sporulation protein YabP